MPTLQELIKYDDLRLKAYLSNVLKIQRKLERETKSTIV